jgi:hypothetical protein
VKQVPGTLAASLDPGLRSRLEWLTDEVKRVAGTSTLSALPAANEDWDGKMVRVRANGAADKLYWCARSADGALGWVELA